MLKRVVICMFLLVTCTNPLGIAFSSKASESDLDINFIKNEIYANSSLKLVYNTLGEVANDSSRPYSERAEALGYLLEIDDFLMSYYNMLQNASQLLELAEAADDFKNQSIAYLYIGQIYALQYNKTMAFYYWTKANDWAVANDDFHLEADANFLKGRLLYELNEPKEAKRYFLRAKYLYQNNKSQATEALEILLPYAQQHATLYLSLIDLIEDNPPADEALTRLSTYRVFDDKSPDYIARTAFMLGLYHQYYGDDDGAIELFQVSLENYEKIDVEALDNYMTNTVQFLMAKSYYALGSYKKSADLLIAVEDISAYDMNDYVKQSERSQQLLIDLESRSSMRLIRYQKTALKVLVAFLILFTLTLVVIYKAYRKNRLLTNEIYHHSITDALTGLLNRRAIIEVLEKRPIADTALALFDIDHFKKINDTYGHQIGDDVLKTLSMALETFTGERGYVGRYGGEEFLLVIDKTAVSEPVLWVEELRGIIETLEWSFSQNRITVSVGLLTTLTEDFDRDFQLCDTLLYKAKANGRNQIYYQ